MQAKNHWPMAIWLAVSILAGCGGGDSSDGAAAEGGKPPVVRIEPMPAEVEIAGSALTLNAGLSSDPENSALTYAWTIDAKPAGSTAELTGANTPTPSLVPDRSGLYEFAVAVSDGHQTSTASLSVTVKLKNAAPTAAIGPVQSTKAGSTVTLDGSASFDTDGNQLTYKWQLVARPAGSAAFLETSDTVRPTFIADVAGTYEVSLIVNDGVADSAPVTATVLVSAPDTNGIPVAYAAANPSVLVGGFVQLFGGGEDPDADQLTYAWVLSERPASSQAKLIGATTPNPVFEADQPGTYRATLVVNDGQVNSLPSTVVVTTNGTNAAPVAHAGAPQQVLVGAKVQLLGSQSSDANDKFLAFRWSMVSKPAGSSAVLADADTVGPSFTADVAGTYVASLIVRDQHGASGQASTTVTAAHPTVNVKPVAKAGPDQNVLTGGVPVVLDGSQSFDANPGDKLTYQWHLFKPKGSKAVLDFADSPHPRFTPDIEGFYSASLVVKDSVLESTSSYVSVIALDPPGLGYLSVANFLLAEYELMPYAGEAKVNYGGCGEHGDQHCEGEWDIGEFYLSATGLSYTVTNVQVANLSSNPSSVPRFENLANGTTIGAGKIHYFTPMATSTNDREEHLRYSFTIQETGKKFVYDVHLKMK